MGIYKNNINENIKRMKDEIDNILNNSFMK